MSTVTPRPVHGDIIHFFNDRSSKVEQATVLSTVVSEIPGTYDVIYIPTFGGLTPRTFLALDSDTFPLLAHFNREAMQLILDPR